MHHSRYEDIHAYRLGQKNGVTDHTSSEIFFKNQLRFDGRFLGQFAVKWILKIPLHLAYVATLFCEILMLSL